MAYVYLHTNLIDGKAYCGETIQEPEKRWGKNGNEYLQKKNGEYQHPAFAAAILKYGWNNFKHEIIFECETEEEALEYEDNYIEEHNLRGPNGYNCCRGGGKPPTLYGNDNPFYGIRPDKAIEASVASRIKYVYCITTDTYEGTIKELSERINRRTDYISKRITQGKTIAGKLYVYVDKNSDGYRTDSEENSLHE